MQQVTPDEAKAHLTELMDAAMRGERVVIARDEQHAVELIPVAPGGRLRKAGTAKGRITVHADFVAPLDDFADYLP
ncbi:MAG TPA: type II toxin-antitoxin system prevent-host-death family antitoxin [Ktedonobacterales bacterium]|nr:type II toxin-antitoxin system prevent-host-death family antitoxin [Ktedonobacterales bacterium]